MTDIVKAWHFTGNTLRNGDPIPQVGEWLEYHGHLVMCESGLHASVHPFDALKYAPGHQLHRVECSGEIVYGDDKLVCSRRCIVSSKDATQLLRRFAKDQALTVVHLWACPQILKDYLQSDSEENRSAARSAAWSASRYAAESAAWSAAESAAESAARADFERRVVELFHD